jgi:hypothetical protein
VRVLIARSRWMRAGRSGRSGRTGRLAPEAAGCRGLIADFRQRHPNLFTIHFTCSPSTFTSRGSGARPGPQPGPQPLTQRPSWPTGPRERFVSSASPTGATRNQRAAPVFRALPQSGWHAHVITATNVPVSRPESPGRKILDRWCRCGVTYDPRSFRAGSVAAITATSGFLRVAMASAPTMRADNSNKRSVGGPHPVHPVHPAHPWSPSSPC